MTARQPTVTWKSPKIIQVIRLVGVVRNWPRVLVDHLQLTKADYVCHLRNGLIFALRGGTDDRHAMWELFVDRIYPMEIAAGDIVVDIGAHIGGFAVPAAKAGARVFAFEPSPANFAMLERNLQLNGVANARLFRTAVSSRREMRKLFLPHNPAQTARYSLQRELSGEAVEVPCLSLDDLVLENHLDHIAVLKVDAEGSEYEVVYGASSETLARIRTIVMECHKFDTPPDWSIVAMQAYLNRRGFHTTARGRMLRAERDK